MSRSARALTLVVGISLALRLLTFMAVVHFDVPLLFDESGYFERALAWREILASLSRLGPPSAEDWARAYGRGHWPPLHPVLLGLGLAIGGPTVATARFVMVLVSALTTLMVYRLALELSDDRVARAAAWMHALYPTFIVYSHLLWSETSLLLVLLAAVWSALRVTAAEGGRRRLAYAAGAGVGLGLATLTRVAAAPFLIVVPLWLTAAVRPRRIGMALAGTALISGLVVLAPWQAVLTKREGRFVPLSTLSGYNLALGNNPWVPRGYGSSWGDESGKARLFAALEEAARRESVSWEAAAFDLAQHEVVRDPRTFLIRSFERLRMLWAPDFFSLRHLFHAVYPPVSPLLAGLLAVVAVACYLLMVTLSILGFAGEGRLPSGILLIAVLVVAGMILPALSFGMSRLHLPLLALLLPIAGRGLLGLSCRLRQSRGFSVLAAVLLLSIIATSLPRVWSLYLLPSSFYAGVFAPVGRWFGFHPVFVDRIVLRRESGDRRNLVIRVTSRETRFGDGSGEWSWSGGSDELSLELVSSRGAPEIVLISPAGSQRFRPITREFWRKWQPIGVHGDECMWTGGGARP